MRCKFYMSNSMAQRYKNGQKVVVTPVKNQQSSSMDYGLEPYAGQIGEVVNYHWLSPTGGSVFYLYTVRMETDGSEVVVHEDELESYVA